MKKISTSKEGKMYINAATKPINEMTLKEIVDEFYMVPLYNKKEDGHWTDWRGERHFKENSYTFACIFHSEVHKPDPEIVSIVEMGEKEAFWLIQNINLKRSDKVHALENSPHYLKELFSPEDLIPISHISEYNSATAEFTQSLYSYRSFSPVAADLYKFALYFQDPILNSVACNVMRYPQDHEEWGRELRVVLEWIERDDGKYIEQTKSEIINHPKGKQAFPFLMSEITKIVELR